MRSLRIAMSVSMAVGLALLSVRPLPAQETIRVGFLGPLTGVFAQAGKDMDDGLKLAFEQVNSQVERVGGKLQNTVVQTYPMVSQFWTYSSQDFLKQPLYSRDYPPAKP